VSQVDSVNICILNRKISIALFHTIAARFLSIVLAAQWYLLFVHSDHPGERFSFESLRFRGSGAIALSLGLWLSTTKWGRKHPIIGLCLMFPSFLAPLFLASNALYILTIFGIVFWSCWVLIHGKEKN
jgi:hypothetical protein